MFAPPTDPVALGVMQIFADRNNARMGTHFIIEPFLNATTRPTTAQGLVPVPDADFVYNYVIALPNVTEYAVVFDRVNDSYTYTIWFNSSQTANTTQNVDEWYGLPLTSFMRALDESIGTRAAREVGVWAGGRAGDPYRRT